MVKVVTLLDGGAWLMAVITGKVLSRPLIASGDIMCLMLAICAIDPPEQRTSGVSDHLERRLRQGQ